MLELRDAKDRGNTHIGWLDSQHTFSFGYYYDLYQRGFSDLLVINDDQLQPGSGTCTHPHADMEIITYVLQGALGHKDIMGSGSIILPGDIQMMSAGMSIWHSEFNASKLDLVHFLQIWIMPEPNEIPSRYQQVHFDQKQKRGRLRLVISPDGQDGSLSINQDVKVYAGLFDGNESAEIDLGQKRYAYVHLARGSMKLNGMNLVEGDGVRIRRERVLRFSEGHHADVLVFNLRPNELPHLGRYMVI